MKEVEVHASRDAFSKKQCSKQVSKKDHPTKVKGKTH